jgi:exodeoxyribonuclease V alpha subunit
MHGGLKVYRGSPTAARTYVEAARGRADDYYLAEGNGVAARFVASAEGVAAAGTLSGDAYEAWVAGYDPATGAAKGRLRSDDQAVRFVEVVVNGPKSWSLAAALHPEIAAAYDAAQDRAAEQVIGWLAEHATTRVGPRGRQVQVPLQELEAVTVRHYTSRAGDPHRHLHLQINARVFAEGRWRGIHTVGVRDSLDAINGIGHTAVITDPGFRTTLAAHGYTVDRESGEVVELAEFVGPFSARAAQITRNTDRYEAEWRAANPGVEPGPKLRRSWDARAWAQARPDKVIPTDGAELAHRWVEELHALGYREPDRPTPALQQWMSGLGSPRAGEIDREAAIRTVVARLGGRRSAWNAADVRGEVEQWVARSGLVADPAVRLELAEDLTARVVATCVPLLTRTDGSPQDVPEHIRALSSREVLAVEDELTTRMIARAETPPPPAQRRPHEAPAGLDPAQHAVCDALAGPGALVVIEGAAGVGKTTTLTATRAALEVQGHRLVVATPTLKAATVAARETGTSAYSAAWLAHHHGYRWDSHGTWRRLHTGDTDPDNGATYEGPSPAAVLSPGDLLLVDEAGMLDQDTARALFVIADEQHARLALVGDRHQLPAVGRGGVLDLAARWADSRSCLVLDTVHRFRDEEYAHLTLAMRTGKDPGLVFDALLARGEIQIHSSESGRSEVLAATAAAAWGEPAGEPLGGEGEVSVVGGRQVLVVADTREQVTALNGTIRDQLVAAGRVDDAQAVTTDAGERVGVGDRVATRRNDRDLEVANRDTWTVTGIASDGTFSLTGGHGARQVPARYARKHLELAYATTVYGAQGDTVDSAHLLVGEHTGAAAAYVGMTRGRSDNVAHLVADDIEEARSQWVATFGRDRADLGPGHAAQVAAEDIDRYGTHRPLDRVLADLRQAWKTEADLSDGLSTIELWRDQLAAIVPLRDEVDRDLAHHQTALEQAADGAKHTQAQLDQVDAAVTADADRLTTVLQQAWRTGVADASRAAQTVHAGPGPLGVHRTRVRRARADLEAWADTWRTVLPGLPADADTLAWQLVRQQHHTETPQIEEAFASHARRTAERDHPELPEAQQDVAAATGRAADAQTAYTDAAQTRARRLEEHGDYAYVADPARRLADLERHTDDLDGQLQKARARVHALQLEPVIRALPADRLASEHDAWRQATVDQQAAEERAARAAVTASPSPARGMHPQRQHPPSLGPRPPDHGFSR